VRVAPIEFEMELPMEEKHEDAACGGGNHRGGGERVAPGPGAALKPWPLQLASWLQAIVTMLAMLGIIRPDGPVMDFVAYKCSNRGTPYSLLKLATRPTSEYHHEIEHTILGKVIQMKKDRVMPVFCCTSRGQPEASVWLPGLFVD
jgi:hypothetical protein